MKKKVLFMLNDMNVGGTEKAFLNLVDTMSPEEYEVTLLLLRRWGGFLDAVPDWVKVETIEGYETLMREAKTPPLPIVKEYLFQGKPLRSTGLLLTHLWYKFTGNRVPYFRYIMRRTQHSRTGYDVAVAFSGLDCLISTYILQKVEAPVKVQWVHFDVNKFRIDKKTTRKISTKYQHVFVVSEEARQSLIHMLPQIEGITRTVPNVISASLCRQQAEQGESFNDGYTGTRIVTLGRLSAEKGQDIIPEVAAELAARGVDFHWYLVGDGKLRSVIEEKATVLGVSDRVVLLGTKTNPYPYLKDADLYVQTSHYEGRCVVIDEAKVFGLPIVTTDVAGAREQLDGLENSRIVERNKEQILQAVLQLLGK